MATLLHDLRWAARSLARNPAFTIPVVLLLALGIGANTAIFSFVSGVILRPLPFPEPDRLVVVTETNLEKDRPRSPVSPRNLEDWEARSRTIERFGQWRDWHFSLVTPEGPRGVSNAIASPGLFDALGVRPVAGRLFTLEENRPGADRVVLVSHRFWTTQLGGDPHAVGQTLNLDEETFTIVGVLPPNLEDLSIGRFDVWAPVSVDPDQLLGRSLRNRQVYARLSRSASLDDARRELTAIAAQLEAEYPGDNAGWSVAVLPLLEDQVAAVRAPLLLFLGAVGLVLLVACANIAILTRARAVRRRKEIAIKAALGVTRLGLVRQQFAESLLLAIVGGSAGVLVAMWLADVFTALAPGAIPRIGDVRLDGRVLGFTALLTAATALLFGLLPALRASRVDFVQDLVSGVKGIASGRGLGVRGVSIAAQSAMALVLLIAAGLLLQSFMRLVGILPGFDPDGVITVWVAPPSKKYETGKQVADLYGRLTRELESIPGVEAVGAVSAGPQFGGVETIDVVPEGHTFPPGQYPQARYFDAGPSYFRAMRIPIREGRELVEGDDERAPRVAVVNETFARRFWPRESAIGKQVELARENMTVEVVGVVGDVREFDVGSRTEPEIYWPYMQQPRWSTYFVVRAKDIPAGLADAIRARIVAEDSDVFISRAQPMNDLIARAVAGPRFDAFVVTAFAAAALLLAALGLYGAVSYSAAQRTYEIGVRMALGAQREDILAMVLRQGLVPTAAGLGVGLLIALAATRLLEGMLFGVAPVDPLTFAVLSAVLFGVAAAACYVPARRAARVDPLVALKHE